MKLEKGKIYKCWRHGSEFELLISNGEYLFQTSLYMDDFWHVKNFHKVEPYEPEAVDTLREVVEWCKDRRIGLAIYTNGVTVEFINLDEVMGSRRSVKDLLTHIRQPQLKEITGEELAKMGYKLKED